MKAFHLLGAAPLYTNSFVLISDAGHAVVIDPAAEVQEYDKIFKENNATLTTILCTHGHYDHVGSAGVLSREWKARIYCEPADCRGSQLFPLKSADSGYAEGEKAHEERYRKLLKNIDEKLVFSKDGECIWICRNCGHIVVGKDAPEVCPICGHPKSFFELKAENY